MNITKRPNGKYRVREMYNGKSYSITYDYKPTQKEAKKELNTLIEKDYLITNDKFINCVNTYLEAKNNILEPTTIRSYGQYIRQLPNELKQTNICDIDKITLQNVINKYAKNHSPKTTKNYWSFISSIIYTYTDRRYRIQLPPPVKVNRYIPTYEDIILMIEQSKGTPYYIPLLLASYGMRIGEIMALTLNDIKDGEIHINKAKTYYNHTILIKKPKTLESNRILKVPTYITDQIKKEKRIYNGCNTAINEWLHKLQQTNNIPLFSIHKFRHFFATELHNRNIPNKIIQKMGGWATDTVLKNVYQHATDYSVIDIFQK